MFNYRGGNSVKSGFYWDLTNWEIVTIAGKGGVLPENGTHRYVKVPIPFLVMIAPILGLLFVVFLPFIGFAMVLGLVGRKVLGVLHNALAHVERVVHPHQQA